MRTSIQPRLTGQPPPPGRQDGGKSHAEQRPAVSWPGALRAVRAWLEPWVMLWRYWRGWSNRPPPPQLQALLDWVQQGQELYLYGSY